MEPYKGLQPYTEENEDIFFGREAEKAILIDKILSDKLTLLFAATGVGKSSLLQAAVMPELKRPARENLDVVYYKDWVSPPLEELQNTILNTLKERGKIDEQFPSREGQGVGSLKDFLALCATFSSEPLVIILDQFEEFFQYQRYSQHFEPFIQQLSEAIRDKETPAVFLISMREDFALNLNAFKGHLPNTLFENYYRLEKLKLKEARAAVEEPVKKIGFRYEKGLLNELLEDLAEQERENRIGSQKELVPEKAPSFVEPPNVQIVCTQLWEEEQHNPDKTIRKQTYKQNAGSKGFIGNYFTKVIDRFSKEEKKLASKAFDHLVTPRGTKMAYPVKDLSEKLRVEANALENVLIKLKEARVIRDQDRKGEAWYELYHDTFSNIIYRWNSEYKAQQRTKRVLIVTGLALLGLFLLIVAYDTINNLTNYHFRLNPRSSNRIELYLGKSKSWDIFKLQKYEAETPHNRSHLEPDKQFIKKPVNEYDDLSVELIGQLPIVKRISAYWKMGEADKALELADKSISRDDLTRSLSVIELLAQLHSQKAFEVLRNHMEDPMEDIYIRTNIISTIGSSHFTGTIDSLVQLLKDQSPDIRSKTSSALGLLGHSDAAKFLIDLLQDQDSVVRDSATDALYQLSKDEIVLDRLRDSDVMNLLIKSLNKQIEGKINAAYISLFSIHFHNYTPSSATKLLVQLNIDAAIKQLFKMIEDQNSDGALDIVQELYLLTNKKIFIQLRSYDRIYSELKKLLMREIKYASGRNSYRQGVMGIIGLLVRIDSNKAIEQLTNLMEEQSLREQFGIMQLFLNITIQNTTILEKLRRSDKLGLLITILKKQMEETSFSDFSREINPGTLLLAQLDKKEALERSLELLQHQDSKVRHNALAMLYQLSFRSNFNEKELKQLRKSNKYTVLINLLKEEMEETDFSGFSGINPSAGLLAFLDPNEALERSLELLMHQNFEVRRTAITTLYQLSFDELILDQIRKSGEFELLVTLLKQYLKVQIKKPTMELWQTLPSYEIPYPEALSLSSPSHSRNDISDAFSLLIKFEDSLSIELFLELLHEENLEVRRNVTTGLYHLTSDKKALNIIRSDEKFSLLVKLLKEQMKKPRFFPTIQGFDETTNLLFQLDKNEAIEQLMELVKSNDPYVRYRTAANLGKLGGDVAVEPLIKLLQDQDWNVRRSAAWALMEIDNSDAIEPLLKQLLDHNWDVRYETCLTLGRFGSGEATSILLTLLYDQRWEVRNRAIKTLGPIGSNEAVGQFVKLLNDDDFSLRVSASQILARLGNAKAVNLLVNRLYNQNQYIAHSQLNETIETLAQLEIDEAVAPLVKLLGNGDWEAQHSQGKIVEALGQIGNQEALEPVLEQLKNKLYVYDPYIRSNAIRALVQLGKGNEKVIDILIGLLEDQDKLVQFSSVLALGKLSGVEAISPLETLFNKDVIQTDNPRNLEIVGSIKLATIAVLLSFGKEDGLEIIQENSNSEHFNERKKVAFILGEIPSEPGGNILLSMLKDDSDEVRIQAIKSIINSQGMLALPHLHMVLFEEHDSKIKKIIINTLAEFASPESISPLRQFILNAEGRVTSRISAIEGLGKIGTDEAASALLEVLGKTEDHYHYKTVLALGKTRSQQALPILSKILREQGTRKAKWRKIRDENTEKYTDEQMDEWRKRLEEVEPQTYMEFELAHSIAMIDPEEGVKLLRHDLAKVREGAWMGLARLPLTDTRPFFLTEGPTAVDLIERLDKERMESKEPLFRHAAYRAIDNMLITIEAYGSTPALKALEDFLSKVQDREGVLTRVEWTIDRLREMEEQQKQWSADAADDADNAG